MYLCPQCKLEVSMFHLKRENESEYCVVCGSKLECIKTLTSSGE